ncbi:hypothetical protein NRB56_44010 [Nocardia sp. RB56]|uniref:Uncharacterized protein n=1 Tax=Nocardia aurantia TaxID=2585199 RepID=A0A7K0DTF7_9NOCA|nr:hypothetical protein [Nocardia aurantia]MQY28817.1 hypothetical protein [Nocardia aurantia]
MIPAKRRIAAVSRVRTRSGPAGGHRAAWDRAADARVSRKVSAENGFRHPLGDDQRCGCEVLGGYGGLPGEGMGRGNREDLRSGEHGEAGDEFGIRFGECGFCEDEVQFTFAEDRADGAVGDLPEFDGAFRMPGAEPVGGAQDQGAAPGGGESDSQDAVNAVPEKDRSIMPA